MIHSGQDRKKHQAEVTPNIAFLAAARLTGRGNRDAFIIMKYVGDSSFKC